MEVLRRCEITGNWCKKKCRPWECKDKQPAPVRLVPAISPGVTPSPERPGPGKIVTSPGGDPDNPNT